MAEKINIYSRDWTEIVFKDKNKSYGAYFLRNIYNDTITRAAIISITFSILAIGFPKIVEWINGKMDNTEKVKVIEVTNLMEPPPIDKNEPPPPPPPPEPPPPLKTTIKYVAPVIVEDAKAEEAPPPTVEELKDVEVGTKTQEGDPEGQEAGLADAPVDAAPAIFTIVEQMPTFPGGEAELVKYLQKNINYPAMERENNIVGTVFLTFVVDPEGKISDIKVLRGVSGGPNLEKEAIRVIKSMPTWKPGKQNGKSVSVQFNLPVRFSLKQ
jgi:protein TonB